MKTNSQKFKQAIAIVFAFFYLITANAQDATPEKFSFQAVVRNSSNQLVSNQLVGVKISILASANANPVVYAETHQVSTNENGLFSIQIGNGTTVDGSFNTIQWKDGIHNIQCEIDLTGGTNYTISTTSQLLSVPYALHAKTAVSATDNNAWKKNGNNNTDVATQFIGTTDFNDLQFKVDSQKSGIIEANDGLYNNTIKNGNTSWGFQALYSNQQGYYNVANGYQSLFSNTTGYYNVANGVVALYNNTTGNNNIAMGGSALFTNITGDKNIALGPLSLYGNTSGIGNIAIGDGTLKNNIYGSSNIAIGSESLHSQQSGYDNVAIGYKSLYSVTGWRNTAIGSEAGRFLPSAVNNVTCIGYLTGWNSTSSNQINIGNFSVTSIGGQVNWGTYSDKRIKTNVKENVPGLAFINQLKPVTYNLDIKKQYELAMDGKKDETSDYPEKYDIEKITQTGFLAQDVEIASKNLGYNFSGVEAPKDGHGLYKLRYSEFVVPLVQAVKDLSTENEVLKQKNIDLEKRLKALEDKISKL